MLISRIGWTPRKVGNLYDVTIHISFSERFLFAEVPVDVDRFMVTWDGKLVSCLPTGSRGNYICKLSSPKGIHKLVVTASYRGIPVVKTEEVPLVDFDVSLVQEKNYLLIQVLGYSKEPDMINVKVDGNPLVPSHIGPGEYRVDLTRGGVAEVEVCISGICKRSVMNVDLTLSLDRWDPEVWVGRDLYGYRVEGVLGEGGFSYVLKASSPGGIVALKVPKLVQSPSGGLTRNVISVLDNLFKEQSALLDLSDSPYLVKLVGVHLDRDTLRKALIEPRYYLEYPPMIVMEYMAGGSVGKLVRDDALFYSDSWKRVVFLIISRISSGLIKIHEKGYVHCDVKPTNVLLDREPPPTAGEIYERMRRREVNPKLADLGSAVKAGGIPPGITLEYSSLEQLASTRQGGIDPRDDIYSLGAMAYFLLTRRYLNDPMIPSMERMLQGEKIDRSIYRLRDYAPLETVGLDSAVVRFLKDMTAEQRSSRPTALAVFNFFTSILN
ncbi:Serine/threonine-protein kinase ArnS [Metallosphaera sp. J1]|uniref:protein kinase domain-containing protein n=1 Tax=Metallosphaera javensis (ex Hofmann et al. 2022) TaxID=99938 RepID=UPI001EDED0FE|nr:protein kinase [Metallosphaera javensis (ex Hofmann et al. 2022)]MCG3109569.1 Serine/threonine-protein kinase ArnS [Metallosphaera javensis (ex Hofmann et al. 2022)]